MLTDAQAILSLLVPYTAKPAAHLRETLAAAHLLMLSDDEAAEVIRRVSSLTVISSPSNMNGKFASGTTSTYRQDPLLVHFGLVSLNPQQIMAVIERRRV